MISAAGLGVIYKNLSTKYNEASILGLREEIRKAREASKGVIGINIMVAMSNFADMVKTAIAEKADIIFSGAGLPLSLPSFLSKDSETKLVPIVSSGRAAKLLCEKWHSGYNYIPDAIVVEGPKAGGHLGYSVEDIKDPNHSLENIVKEVVEVVRTFGEKHSCHIPVIAGGGIYSGADIHSIMELGAEGVQLGTRFVTTYECDADDAFKQSYIDAKEEDIEIIQSPVGMPGRAIKGRFLERVKEGLTIPKSCPFDCIKTCKYDRSPYCIMLALYSAFKGKLEKGYAFCGSNAWRADRLVSVKELISSLKSEYERALAK